ncbi:AhpC/TSA family protein [Pelagibius litoralis]|uniref:AhpC/TSA family protein n=1 Tax=Pelagibius litoralis TaxID=374515 RepID=A0A967KBV9_9PROT|nr:peroxiredoxin-like family protein [Pelagibius litoralis]NIA71322.1 AhpC/TSA family protein [Pelagibius litoralis]
MATPKPEPGQSFPNVSVPALNGGDLDLSQTKGPDDWTLVVVYRGKHCPICTTYLRGLNELVAPLQEIGVTIVAVSADSKARATAQMAEVAPTYEVGYDLTVDQMTALGLYISSPRLGMDAERPFAEPGLFLIDAGGNLKVLDISNVPFARPDLGAVFSGIRFMRSMTGDYPANGTYV